MQSNSDLVCILRYKEKEIYLNECAENYLYIKPGSILREKFPGKEGRRFKLREENFEERHRQGKAK